MAGTEIGTRPAVRYIEEFLRPLPLPLHQEVIQVLVVVQNDRSCLVGAGLGWAEAQQLDETFQALAVGILPCENNHHPRIIKKIKI